MPERGQDAGAYSILTYSRDNGLTVDSTVDIPMLFASASCLNNLSDTLDDGKLVCTLRLQPLSLHERPSIPQASIGLLQYVQQRENVLVTNSWNFPALRKRSKTKILDLPLLKSDDELDCIRLQSNVRRRVTADIRAHIPPAEPLNASRDEGSEFPQDAYVYHEELTKSLITDRIYVSKGAITCIEQTLQDTSDEAETITHVFETALQKSKRIRKITPPLTPTPAQEEYFVPDSEVFQVPLSSDPSTLLDADLDAAREAVLQDQSLSSLPTTPCLSPIAGTSVIELGFPRIRALRIEEPLMLLEPIDASPYGIPSFRQAMEDLQSAQVNFAVDHQGAANDIVSDDMVEVLQKANRVAVQSIQQEEMDHVDAIARIPIPAMDFDIPELEWLDIGEDPKRHFESIMDNHKTIMSQKWQIEHNIQAQLHWIPFPSKLGRVPLTESIDDIDSQSFDDATNPVYVPDSSNYVWKKPGIAILWDEDDEFLEPSHKHVGQEPTLGPARGDSDDLPSFIKKRKLGVETSSSTKPILSPVDLIAAPKAGFRHPFSNPMLVSINDPSAPTTLLKNFVNFHNSKKQKVDKSYFFACPTLREGFSKVSDSRNTERRLTEIVDTASTKFNELIVVPAPFPLLKGKDVPANIVAALSLPRSVLARVEKLLLYVRITERDFDRWNSIAWDRRAISRSPVVSSLAAEADVIVSPSSGILITSLIKANQQPLPGQKGKSAIRERIERVSLRYERLIILVTEASCMEESPRDLTDSECAALADFTGFVSGLNTETQIYYVGGGEATLSHWLAYFIVKYSYEVRKVDEFLIDSETNWELILRRAGMNAFAAQVVLATLKEPRGVSSDDFGSRGLAAYINMTPQQRSTMFGQLLGGERVLQRVEAVLDAQWA